MSFIIAQNPQSLSAVVGQDTTFTVVASTSINPLSAGFTYSWYTSAGSSITNVASATNINSYTIDPLASQNGLKVFAVVNCLSGSPLTFRTALTSTAATLTILQTNFPFNNFTVWPETGPERHKRLRHLGYI